jgi:hypothetical protein
MQSNVSEHGGPKSLVEVTDPIEEVVPNMFFTSISSPSGRVTGAKPQALRSPEFLVRTEMN